MTTFFCDKNYNFLAISLIKKKKLTWQAFWQPGFELVGVEVAVPPLTFTWYQGEVFVTIVPDLFDDWRHLQLAEPGPLPDDGHGPVDHALRVAAPFG